MVVRKNDILIIQKHFSDIIVPIGFDARTTSLTDSSLKGLPHLVGQQLQWCASHTRFDFSFTAKLDIADAKNSGIKLANKSLEPLKYDFNPSLLYGKFPENSFVLIYTDSSFQKLKDVGSQGAYDILIPDIFLAHFIVFETRVTRFFIGSIKKATLKKRVFSVNSPTP